MSHGYTSHNHRCCDEARPSQKRTDVGIARCGGPVLCKRVCGKERDRLHMGEAGEPTSDGLCAEAHLGLATTRELLDELRARAGVGTLTEENSVTRGMLGGMAEAMWFHLTNMPSEVLNYRTVEGGRVDD